MRIRTRTAAIAAAIAIGLAVGLGGFTFVYARGASYLTNDPQACANCHIMEEHFSAWIKSSHHTVATCNDCHTPHDLVGKYTTKAMNGFWHSFYFTTGNFPDPLRITPRNHEITEEACRYCHAPIVESIDAEHLQAAGRAEAGMLQGGGGAAGHAPSDPEEFSCVRCHRHVGHWLR